MSPCFPKLAQHVVVLMKQMTISFNVLVINDGGQCFVLTLAGRVRNWTDMDPILSEILLEGLQTWLNGTHLVLITKYCTLISHPATGNDWLEPTLLWVMDKGLEIIAFRGRTGDPIVGPSLAMFRINRKIDFIPQVTITPKKNLYGLILLFSSFDDS
jgi:hypothetical protein